MNVKGYLLEEKNGNVFVVNVYLVICELVNE